MAKIQMLLALLWEHTNYVVSLVCVQAFSISPEAKNNLGQKGLKHISLRKKTCRAETSQEDTKIYVLPIC